MSIVFAHFYASLPKHLVLNIKRTISLFPEHEIFLVTDLNPENIKINKLNIFQFNPNRNWNELENLLVHDKNFRNNFWFTSIARFLAIAEFAKYREGEIFHLESDVIISSDFPFKLFTKTKALFLFPLINDSQAIASCLYIRNADAAKYLSDLAVSEALKNPKTTDMHVLRVLSRIYSENFKFLPTAPSQESAMPTVGNNFLTENKKMISYFGGVFDGFDIGRYLFGMDPRNRRGFSTLREFDPNVYLNVRKLDLLIKNNREFPFILDINENKEIPVFALHMHSKDKKLFIPSKFHKVIRKAINDSKKSPKRKFYYKTFCNSLRLAMLRRFSILFRKMLKCN